MEAAGEGNPEVVSVEISENGSWAIAVWGDNLSAEGDDPGAILPTLHRLYDKHENQKPESIKPPPAPAFVMFELLNGDTVRLRPRDINRLVVSADEKVDMLYVLAGSPYYIKPGQGHKLDGIVEAKR
jgi:hypothetical protein